MTGQLALFAPAAPAGQGTLCDELGALVAPTLTIGARVREGMFGRTGVVREMGNLVNDLVGVELDNPICGKAEVYRFASELALI
jgi:hypothetical protein